MYVTTEFVNVKSCASVCATPHIALDRKGRRSEAFLGQRQAEAEIEANGYGWVTIEQVVSAAEGTGCIIADEKRFASGRPDKLSNSSRSTTTES